MNILVLTQIIPYPPDAGPRVKTWHVLRYLASRGHRVTLASFIRPEEVEHVEAVRAVCSAVYTVPIRRSRVADVGYWLRSHLSGRPFLIERDDLAEMHELVQHIVAEDRIDIIQADQLTMAQFAAPFASGFPGAARLENGQRPAVMPVTIFDAHNAVWTIVERMRHNAPWFLRPAAAIEAARIKRYEGEVVRHFSHTLSVAQPDRTALLEAVRVIDPVVREAQIPVTVVPIAVDTEQLQPAERQPGSMNIVTLGTLHYPPNADGIRWFAKEVFPLVRREIPQARLTIIGKNPPVDFVQLAEEKPDAVQVTGYVPDLAPYMDDAALMVVAVRAGGGMRVRILEAFARAMPVVTTTVGLEGIDARPGEDVLVADDPEAFARDVIRLLHDQQFQAKLARNGRRLAETAYDWQVVLEKLDDVYQALAPEVMKETVVRAG